MKNYIGTGGTVTHAHATAVTSGQLVAIGTVLAVAVTSQDANALGQYVVDGEFLLPKSAGAIGQGNPLNFDLGNGELTEALPAVAIVGGAVATQAADNDATTVRARLVFGAGVTGGSGS